MLNGLFVVYVLLLLVRVVRESRMMNRWCMIRFFV